MNPIFNCYNNFLLQFFVDKITTGTWSFVSVNEYLAGPAEVEITEHFYTKFRIRLFLQLIKDISRVLQKMLKYFNENVIFAFASSELMLPVILNLKLKDLESVNVLFGASL